MDIRYLLWLQELRQSSSLPLTEAFTLISNLVYFPLWVAGFIFLYWRIDKRAGLWLLLASVSVELAKITFKLGLAVHRPFKLEPLLQPVNRPESYSFPSGHSMWSVVEYVGWALWFKGQGLIALGTVLAILTAFSRNWLGVHTPQDVLVGLVLGLIVLLGAYKLVRWSEKNDKWDETLLLTGTLLCCIIGYYISHKGYPQELLGRKLLTNPAQSIAEGFAALGLFVGVVWGWYLDKKFLKYTCPAQCGWKESFWGLLGLVFFVVYGVYAYVLLPMFLRELEGMFLVGVTLALWVMLGYPWILQKFRL